MERRVGLYRHRRASDSFSLFSPGEQLPPTWGHTTPPPPSLLSSVQFRNFFFTNPPPPRFIWYSLLMSHLFKSRDVKARKFFLASMNYSFTWSPPNPPPIRHSHRSLGHFWCRHPSDSSPFLLLSLRLLQEPTVGWERTDKRRISAAPCICSRDTAHMSMASCAQLLSGWKTRWDVFHHSLPLSALNQQIIPPSVPICSFPPPTPHPPPSEIFPPNMHVEPLSHMNSGWCQDTEFRSTCSHTQQRSGYCRVHTCQKLFGWVLRGRRSSATR